jgi:aspartyl-tRNA(Asn)/glutamyl-tRNA(Gln) amidotransferase subunit C
MLAFAVPSDRSTPSASTAPSSSGELTRERVAAIAALANLELNPGETDLFARQLAGILAYAEEVQRADTTNVPPTSAVLMQTSTEREDVVGPCLDVRDALANAPDAALDAGLFRVPRVIG